MENNIARPNSARIRICGQHEQPSHGRSIFVFCIFFTLNRPLPAYQEDGKNDHICSLFSFFRTFFRTKVFYSK